MNLVSWALLAIEAEGERFKIRSFCGFVRVVFKSVSHITGYAGGG